MSSFQFQFTANIKLLEFYSKNKKGAVTAELIFQVSGDHHQEEIMRLKLQPVGDDGIELKLIILSSPFLLPYTYILYYKLLYRK